MTEALVKLALPFLPMVLPFAVLVWLVYRGLTQPPATEPPADSLSGCLTGCILCEYWAAAGDPYTCRDCGVCRRD